MISTAGTSKNNLKKIVSLVLASAFLCISLQAEGAPDSDQEGRYSIHVLTMGQGDDLFSRFGHIAVLVMDQETRTKKVYNFGTFDFTDPNLQIKYARGFLNYWLSVLSYSSIVDMYRYFDREMVARTLNLSPEKARILAERLEINARPENSVYAYRHYIDNCCTRIRDVLDEAAEGAIGKGRKTNPTGRTFRYWTKRALEGEWIMSTLILFSLGPSIDEPIPRWDEQFLPDVLAEDLDNSTLKNGEPLVKEKKIVLKRRGPPVGKSVPLLDLFVTFLLFGALLLSFGAPTIVGAKRWSQRLTGVGLLIWGLIGGLGGVVLTVFWTWTTHYDTHYNENLLITPLPHLLIIGPALMLIFKGKLKNKTTRLLKNYLLVCLAVIVISIVLKFGPFHQGNWDIIAFALACNTGALLALWRSGVGRSPQSL